MKIAFNNCTMKPETRVRLQQINSIIAEYTKLGLKLTLRQLYYQLVSRDVIRNDQKEYRKLSDILKDGRMCGMVDWDAIEDRLRTVSLPASWNTPGDVMQAAINSFEMPPAERSGHIHRGMGGERCTFRGVAGSHRAISYPCDGEPGVLVRLCNFRQLQSLR